MATRVTIKVDLERRLRAAANGEEVEPGIVNAKLVSELVGLLDAEQLKRAASSESPGSSVNGALGYKELVALFHFHLGSKFAPPPGKPGVSYIVRIVNKAKELGIDQTNVEQICAGAIAGARAPYSLDYLVFRASEHFARAAEPGRGTTESGEPSKGKEDEDEIGRVYTGRPI